MWVPRYIGLLMVALLLELWSGSLLAQGTPLDRAILRYQQMLRRHPGDARGYYRLGDAYIQKPRESGDVTYFKPSGTGAPKGLGHCPTL
jgi:hypothetical protein